MNAHRIALTGASGMLGSAILRELARFDNVSTLGLDLRKPSGKNGRNIEYKLIDLTRGEEVASVLQQFRPTALIHAAAIGMQHPLPDAATLRKINVELPASLAQAIIPSQNCRFVHISSGLAYKDQGRPLREDDPLGTLHAYGASKVVAEKCLQALEHDRPFPLAIMRPFSFTGEGDFGTRLFPSLLRSAVERRPFEMSAGDQVRDYSSVNDIALGVVAAAFESFDNTNSTEIFNLGSGDSRPLREVVCSIITELGLEVDLRPGARPRLVYEPMFIVADSTRAQRKLNWNRQESLAHAVWKLALTSFPSLNLKEPPHHEGR
jgi:UDP-glucose 4-epimerase